MGVGEDRKWVPKLAFHPEEEGRKEEGVTDRLRLTRYGTSTRKPAFGRE